MRTVKGAQDRPGRLRLYGRRLRRWARPAALAGAALLAVAVSVSALSALRPGAWFAGMISDAAGAALALREIRIEGRANTPEPLLMAAIGARRGEPLLDFSPGEARARIETLGWVESATVERRLPGTLVVRLVERRPFAIWQNQGRFTVIDRAGTPIADSEIHRFGPLPLIVGAGAPGGAAALLDAIHHHAALTERFEAAVRISERRWNLRLKPGIEVLLPEGGEAAAIARLAELHQLQALLDRPLALVDLRLPDRLVVRPAGEPARPAAPAPAGRRS